MEEITFSVSEYFSSFQGEGPYTGRYCLFIRLANCNFACPFCDSRDRLGKVNHELTIENILELLIAGNHRHLVITGGEPMLYQEKLARLQAQLSPQLFVEVETNGSIGMSEMSLRNWHFNISPKVWNVDAYDHKLLCTDTHVYKFPLSKENYPETIEFIAKFGIKAKEIYVMPLCETPAEYLEQQEFVAEMAEKHHWNFSTRLQILHRFR